MRVSTPQRLVLTLGGQQTGMAAQPQRVVESGVFPAWLFDQTEFWIDPNGFQHRIADLPVDTCKHFLDMMLANARQMREHWAFETKQVYDNDQRARRWMLDQPVIVALMQRIASDA